MARVAFLVGSGRSGTALFGQRILPALGADARHEFKCEQVQEVSVLYNNGFSYKLKDTIARLYESAVAYSDKELFIDCSNKLSFLIPMLVEIFPEAKFVHIVRNGLDTCNSFYHKLENECYTDRGVKALNEWMLDSKKPKPPQEKEWWWPMPQLNDHAYWDFLTKWGRWERICWYWQEVNKVIERDTKRYVKPENILHLKLEALTGDDDLYINKLCAFLGLQWREELRPELQHKHNVIEWPPKEHKLTRQQRRQFKEISGEMQKYYGYK